MPAPVEAVYSNGDGGVLVVPTETERAMDFVQGLLGAAATIVALVVIVGLLAALFMIVFGIATGIDDNIQG